MNNENEPLVPFLKRLLAAYGAVMAVVLVAMLVLFVFVPVAGCLIISWFFKPG